MANKQRHKYSLGFNTRDQINALAGSAKRRNTNKTLFKRVVVCNNVIEQSKGLFI